MTQPAASQKHRSQSDATLLLGLLAAIIFFLASGFLSCRNVAYLMDDAKQVARTHEIINSLERILSLAKDAETGQRGFIITNESGYLLPYTNAVAAMREQIDRTEDLVASIPEQAVLMTSVKEHVANKLAELDETVNLMRNQGFDAAKNVVLTDRGKGEMDALRQKLAEMVQNATAMRIKRVEGMQQAFQVAIVSGIVTAGVGLFLSFIISFLMKKEAAARRRQNWLQSAKVGLGVAITGDQSVKELGDNILNFLCKYLDAHAGAVFTRMGAGFKRAATLGVPANSQTPEYFDQHDGLLGRVSQGTTPILLNDVPEGYLAIGSGLGQGIPKHLILFPSVAEEQVNAVVELGFIHPIGDDVIELLGSVSDQIGVAVKSSEYRDNLQQLLEETQRQSEELQAQSEELRVSNEELEEQSRALKESQTRLEQQQVELEQTNSQLEEQAQQLENQRDDLSRAKSDVEIKAAELQRSSQFKSDFLANMSHELRTPLNSLLILSKLLADNPNRNLSTEQVEFARTIHNSGNDLLTLINDILDLSKIEAGHMEVNAEPISLARSVLDLTRVFEPMAQQKGLAFSAFMAPGCPESIVTDRQRLEQILKNLLSNACKFTEHGKVELIISAPRPGYVAFEVKDTGIGISGEHQRGIFEAFHQADSTISRRYGGTGLGLSISRELSRLLGGAIHLRSEPGEGSTFTLELTAEYKAGTQAPALQQSQVTQPTTTTLSGSGAGTETVPRGNLRVVDDDRANLTAGSRSILVVEDDQSFARILYDMVREQHFLCLIANTAEDALIVARQYLPSALLLDVGLPDNSGLTVLDRLKQDPRTRHIPIHVISADDYSQTAFSLGAVGYMLKPVRHEAIVDALHSLQTRLAESVRRVLIVEDDAVQRDSLGRLLGSSEVETVGVGSAAECLERLKTSTFDCMVLDLSLPDATGYSLLETLSQEHSYSFPPVIVYTGHDISSAEEQKLRKYSKSIIIKGAKSPERLLDEVTLFLHQVVSELPVEQQNMLKIAQNRDAILEGRRILIVEDDVRNIYSLTNILEPRGAIIQIARNGREAIEVLEAAEKETDTKIHLVLMDVMMPEMDGLTATRAIRTHAEWKRLPIIMLTAKAMKNDQERCLEAGANDYMAKPLDVEKLLSLVRVWMPR